MIRSFKSIQGVKLLHNRLIRQQSTFANALLPKCFLSEISTLDIEQSTNKYELHRHGHGESYHEVNEPQVILYPKTADEISKLVSLCNIHKIPIIPFGQGTSLEGHVHAVKGGISLDMKHFTTIEYKEGDAFVSVGAGVTRNTLNQELRHSGYQFMIDPGADASIGGMVACSASGTAAVKYGTMKENILGMEVVLPNGMIVNCGTKGALKSSAGYDLLHLFCGSEGTLGVITKMVVKVHAIPQYIAALQISFDSLHHAASMVQIIKQLNIPVQRCELLDTTSITAFNRYSNESLVETPHLFVELATNCDASLTSQMEELESLKEEFNVIEFKMDSTEEGRKKLWAARHQLYYAAIALRPGAYSAFLTDACVPMSHFASIIEETSDLIQQLQLVGPCFGHAGDGNFHCILPLTKNDSPEYMQKVHQVNEFLMNRALEVGGTCTGEHGIGYGKIKYLKRQYGQGAVELMKTLKLAIDPNNIMNPGKIVE